MRVPPQAPLQEWDTAAVPSPPISPAQLTPYLKISWGRGQVRDGRDISCVWLSALDQDPFC